MRDRPGRTIKGILLSRYITKPKGGKAEPDMWMAKALDRVKNPELQRGTFSG